MRRTGQRNSSVRLWHLLVAGLAYALLTALAHPPVGFWPLALLAPAPLVWASMRAGRVSVLGLACLAVGTLPLWAYTHMFLLKVAPAGYPVLCVYLSLYPALFVAGHRLVRRAAGPVPAAVSVPLVWVALELCRGELVFTGYPWYLAATPLVELPFLAAPAALLSVYGVSVLVSAFCGALGDAAGWGVGAAPAMAGRSRRSGGVQGAAVLTLWGVLSVVARSDAPGPTEPLRVAVVQTNIPQDNKTSWTLNEKVADFRRFMDLTRQAAVRTPPPDVILWPETMFPGAALNPEALEVQRRAQESGVVMRLEQPMLGPDGELVTALPLTVFADELLRRQKDLGVPMLVGAIAFEGLRYEELPTGAIKVGRDARFNSVFVVADGRVDPARYDKIDLTPFGEVVPYAWRYPPLQQRLVELGARGMSFDLGFGREPRTLGVPIKRAGAAGGGAGGVGTGVMLNVGEIYVAAPICFEVTKPLTCRTLAVGVEGTRASMLFNPSNDGWFAEFPGREVHLQLARWRSVELGLPMVRSVNTGLSAVIDARGRVTDLGPPGVERPSRVDGVLHATVPIVPSGAGTVFARGGYVLLVVLLGCLAVTTCVWGMVERRLRQRALLS